MHSEQVTPIHPRSLSDKELVRFAEDYVNNGGLNEDYQKELIKRLSDKLKY
jgi:hypothetical protein